MGLIKHIIFFILLLITNLSYAQVNKKVVVGGDEGQLNALDVIRINKDSAFVQRTELLDSLKVKSGQIVFGDNIDGSITGDSSFYKTDDYIFNDSDGNVIIIKSIPNKNFFPFTNDVVIIGDYPLSGSSDTISNLVTSSIVGADHYVEKPALSGTTNTYRTSIFGYGNKVLTQDPRNTVIGNNLNVTGAENYIGGSDGAVEGSKSNGLVNNSDITGSNTQFLLTESSNVNVEKGLALGYDMDDNTGVESAFFLADKGLDVDSTFVYGRDYHHHQFKGTSDFGKSSNFQDNVNFQENVNFQDSINAHKYSNFQDNVNIEKELTISKSIITDSSIIINKDARDINDSRIVWNPSRQTIVELNVIGRGFIANGGTPAGGSNFTDLNLSGGTFGVFATHLAENTTSTSLVIGTGGSTNGTPANPWKLAIDFRGYRGQPKAKIFAADQTDNTRNSYLSFEVAGGVNGEDYGEKMRLGPNGEFRAGNYYWNSTENVSGKDGHVMTLQNGTLTLKETQLINRDTTIGVWNGYSNIATIMENNLVLNEVNVFAHIDINGSGELELFFPIPSITYAGKKINVKAIDNNVADDVTAHVVNGILDGTNVQTEYIFTTGESATFICMPLITDINTTYYWVKF